jgi:hypothetical protein
LELERLRFWPTPTASQTKPARPPSPSRLKGTHGWDLQDAVGHVDQQAVGGQLNPQWVEWLMGFPLGWTDLEDLVTQ